MKRRPSFPNRRAIFDWLLLENIASPTGIQPADALAINLSVLGPELVGQVSEPARPSVSYDRSEERNPCSLGRNSVRSYLPLNDAAADERERLAARAATPPVETVFDPMIGRPFDKFDVGYVLPEALDDPLAPKPKPPALPGGGGSLPEHVDATARCGGGGGSGSEGGGGGGGGGQAQADSGPDSDFGAPATPPAAPPAGPAAPAPDQAPTISFVPNGQAATAPIQVSPFIPPEATDPPETDTPAPDDGLPAPLPAPSSEPSSDGSRSRDSSASAGASGTLVVGPDAGGPPLVKVLDAATGLEKLSFLAYDLSFKGGVRVATGDFTGDGVLDVVAGEGPGGNGRVRVHDGVTGLKLSSGLGNFHPYQPGSTDAVFVAVGDVTGDGKPDIITGTDGGTAAPEVRVFSGTSGSLVATIGLDKSAFAGGVRVAAGDVNGDGRADIIVGAGPGSRPRVAVFDGGNRAELYNFFCYDYAFGGGVYVAAGDLTGDGKADIIVGPGPGHAPEVRAFHGADTAYLAKFLAYDASFTGGVRVAAVDANGDGKADIATAAGPLGNQVRLFDGQKQSLLKTLLPYGPTFQDGLFVAGPAKGAGGAGGMTSTAVWVSGSGGTAEGGAPGVISLARDNIAGALTVNISLSGTATRGSDYTDPGNTATFLDQAAVTYVNFEPIDDALIEGTETIILTIEPGAGYTISTPSSGTITIDDNEPVQPTFPPALCPPGVICPPGLVNQAPGLNFTVAPTSEGPVHFFDGTLRMSQTDLQSSGFGLPWGLTRSWTNHAAYADNSLGGSGWVISQLPYLRQSGGYGSTTIAAISDGTTAHLFDYNFGSGSYLPRYFLQEKLTEDTGAKEFVLTDTTGARITFHNFDLTLPANKKGQFKKYVDPAGNEISVTSYSADNKPAELQRTATFGGVTTTESYQFSYVPSGANAGEISNVLLRRQINGGGWTTVRQVDYAYYDGVEANGNARDLKTAAIKDGSGNVLDTYYYRYYTAGQANGYQGGLKYAFSPLSYARLKAAYADPTTATDAQAAPYADLYLEYNAAKLVTKEIVQGAGCSVCTGGLGTYSFSFSVSGFADGHNTWSRKAVETLPDGNQNIVYTNFAGQVMLKVFKDVPASREWITFYKYDDNGRLLWTANPSAVSGYDQTRPDLLDNQSGNYQHLRDNQGLIEARTYYTSTTATSTTPGGASGFLEKVELKRGELGSAVLQERQDYFTRSAFGITFIVIATSSVYRNTDGTGAQTTSYSYTWIGSTAGFQSITVTLPIIGTGQNGPGTAVSETTFFDNWERPVWHKDGDGFLHYAAYDMGTGAVTKIIVDVDHTRTGDFIGLPTGWTTPTGGGLHLITQMEVDGLGRTTKLTQPAGNITYSVYKDTVYEVRVYPGWDTGTNRPTGPTQLMRQDRSGGYYETLTMSATPTVVDGKPTGGEAVGSLETLSRQHTNDAWQVTHVDAYFALAGLTYSTAVSLGTENTHFYRTRYNYDNRGRRNKITLPTGTIEKTDFDSLSRPSAKRVGTSDANLVQTVGFVYDDGGIGDSNLTEKTEYPGGGAANRVSKFYFDWRNRQAASKNGVEGTESTLLNRPIYYFEFDNLSQVIATEQYDGDNVTIVDANSDGVPAKPSSSLLRARSTTSFDDQGRDYRTQTFSVDQSTGAVSSNFLKTDIWYGKRGQVLKTAAPGGLVNKAESDGAGRATKSYQTDGGGDTAWSDADDVTGDAVLEQTENQYDANGNLIFATLRQRFHDETATGALNNPTTAPKARVSYVAGYYDKADRLTDTVNVGTNAGTAYTRPGTVPARSDTVLVVSQTYNTAGWVENTTDPRGIIDKSFYDNLGRTTKTIEAYVDGTPDNNTDRTTELTYDGSGHVLTVKAHLTGGAYQKTQFVYGVTTGSGSNVNSNDILAETRHPDKTSGDPSTSEKDVYTVNALGERKTLTDRNGNVHTYSFDVVSRLTTDAVTTLGTGVDGAVRRAEIAYDTGGRAYLFTNYDAASAGNIVNQVQRDFNGLGQPTKEYQSHSGAVNTGTTPKVQYVYSEMSGGANHSRLVSMTYPNGKVLNYNYTATLDIAISRYTSLSDTTGTVESFEYLGLDTVVRRAHPQPGVDLTYIKQSGEGNGDAGDQYTGLDRFARAVDQRWRKTSDGTHSDRFKYGYDRNGNRLYRENALDAAFSELYHANGPANGYDSLDQLLEFRRGTLSDTNSDLIPDTVTTASRSQVWTLDAQGNFTTLTSDGSPQNRTHNKQNQVTVVGGNNLTFDANGNLKTDETAKQFFFDAWNRLVEVKTSGGSTLVTYKYDVLYRRIVETVSGTARDLYYSAAWQVLEEREGANVKVQHVWSPIYVDALVLRDRDADGNQGNGLEERLYVQQDANFNVTALISASGQVLERYAYDAYGQPTILAPDWTTRGSSQYAWIYLHQGGRYEVVTGLYHFRHREMSATLGRWIQVDPLGLAPDTNLYRLVHNRPTTATDPSGLIVSGGRAPPMEELPPRLIAGPLPEIPSPQWPPGFMPNPEPPTRGNIIDGSYQHWIPIPEPPVDLFPPQMPPMAPAPPPMEIHECGFGPLIRIGWQFLKNILRKKPPARPITPGTGSGPIIRPGPGSPVPGPPGVRPAPRPPATTPPPRTPQQRWERMQEEGRWLDNFGNW
jgi:RHS repeat-associated protein